MNSLNTIFIVLSILLGAGTCIKENTENCHMTIRFDNQTDKSLFILETSERYYDKTPNYIHSLAWRKVLPNSSFNLVKIRPDCWEYDFTGPMADKELWIFPADLEILESHDWKEVLEKRLFLKEYKLTLEDLRRMNWRIVFSENDIKK